MDICADIKWIQNELNKVRDPDLVEVFKRLLILRKKSFESTIEEYNNDIAESEKNIDAGKVYSQEQIKTMRKEWKKSL